MRSVNLKINIRSMLILIIGVPLIASISACGIANHYKQEKNRKAYLLSNSGSLDPKVGTNIRYATHQFRFLEKYKVTHDWPKGMDACGYSIMELPESKQNGYWYGSYDRLGDMFEYKGKTFQESSTLGYPKGTSTSSSKDRYVRRWKKIDGLGVERKHGFTPICWQPLGGTSHTLVVRLYIRSVDEWRKALQKNAPNGVFSMQQVGNNNWLTQEFDLKPSGLNLIAGKYKTWILPIGDTGYTYAFQLGASTESLKYPRTHATMKKIFRHLIESVKIEPLNKTEAELAHKKVKKLIQEMEEYELRSSGRK